MFPDNQADPSLADATLAIRAGFERSNVGEHGEPIHATSSFVFDSAAEAAARFSGEEDGFIYSRFTNPTVQYFERRLAALEGSEACIATASGMAAYLALTLGTLKSGDRIVASRNMFGSTVNLFRNYLPRFGIEVVWADSLDINDWAPLVTPGTRYLVLETPTNPLIEVADIAAFADLAHANDALLAVDNCFCTPALQKPLEHGADVVLHSATKFLDGQGRMVGGAVCGSKAVIEEITAFMRSGGPAMSPFNAWVFVKGLETLPLRMRRHCESAMVLAEWLDAHLRVRSVFYPGLASHPGFEIARRQQSMAGAILTFEIEGGRDAAWACIDAVNICSRTGNLGDTRTTITHPASTTHARMSAEDREHAGIGESLIRLSVGLEDSEDIRRDLEQALAAVGR
ncbi:MAG: O-succinylhomoserine sulfhydrylase [Gammaproteobacteria bacterium]|nr:MAG: O-succinylhomoserine sulfhydrylase [Gammaproteobacteria bacterium]PIE37944.1 MAG: O-succinylhomoserine sulfhydrylase [Gammaproteobacteria bacterium]